MKTLILIRHGKSSWKHRELEDFERPLNGRGRRDTPLMAGLLPVVETLPDCHNTVALFGHNPGFTDLVNCLSHAHFENLPTAGVAVLALPIDVWRHVADDCCADKCELIYCSYPKQLGQLQ